MTYSYQDAYGNSAGTASSSNVTTNYVNATPAPTATPTPTPDASATPTATPVSTTSVGTGGSGGSSGCTFLSTNNRQERDNTALYEFLVWMMICAVIVKQAEWMKNLAWRKLS